MSTTRPHRPLWNLRAPPATPFLLLALFPLALTLRMSWQLAGGAVAVNRVRLP